MKCLISPTSFKEARLVVNAGCDIVDVKNVAEGSLGAQPPWVTHKILSELSVNGGIFSIALGDLPNKPGTIGLAAYAAAQLGADYIKAGLYDVTNYDEAFAMMRSIVKSIRMVSDDAIVVASGYADFKRFSGVAYDELVNAAKDTGSDVVMLDTAIKDGNTLFDALSVDEIKDFVDRGHAAGMKVALAGSIGIDHIDTICQIKPDIIGVRGAVCVDQNRENLITAEGIQALKKRLAEIPEAV